MYMENGYTKFICKHITQT